MIDHNGSTTNPLLHIPVHNYVLARSQDQHKKILRRERVYKYSTTVPCKLYTTYLFNYMDKCFNNCEPGNQSSLPYIKVFPISLSQPHLPLSPSPPSPTLTSLSHPHLPLLSSWQCGTSPRWQRLFPQIQPTTRNRNRTWFSIGGEDSLYLMIWHPHWWDHERTCTPTQRNCICSAFYPHYSRNLSSPSTLHFRTVSAFSPLTYSGENVVLKKLKSGISAWH